MSVHMPCCIDTCPGPQRPQWHDGRRRTPPDRLPPYRCDFMLRMSSTVLLRCCTASIFVLTSICTLAMCAARCAHAPLRVQWQLHPHGRIAQCCNRQDSIAVHLHKALKRPQPHTCGRSPPGPPGSFVPIPAPPPALRPQRHCAPASPPPCEQPVAPGVGKCNAEGFS